MSKTVPKGRMREETAQLLRLSNLRFYANTCHLLATRQETAARRPSTSSSVPTSTRLSQSKDDEQETRLLEQLTSIIDQVRAFADQQETILAQQAGVKETSLTKLEQAKEKEQQEGTKRRRVVQYQSDGPIEEQFTKESNTATQEELRYATIPMLPGSAVLYLMDQQRKQIDQVLRRSTAKMTSLQLAIEQEKERKARLLSLQGLLQRQLAARQPSAASGSHTSTAQVLATRPSLRGQAGANRRLQRAAFEADREYLYRQFLPKYFPTALQPAGTMSLSLIIEKLFEETAATHPWKEATFEDGTRWLLIGPHIWPPHLELILRSGVAIQNPSNTSFIASPFSCLAD